MTRRALVIGCGGTIGGAWAVAALAALAEHLDWDPRTADVLQGTSAGAELVTLLAGGYRVGDLVDMHTGAATDPVLRDHIAATPPGVPPVPLPLPLAPTGLLRDGGGHTRLTGIAPRGRGDATWLQHLADSVAGPGGRLPHPGARLVAYDPQRGERVAFGAPGAPRATAGAALRASWAVPGWMPPVRIDGRYFVDGGAASTASVDLIGADEAEEIYVIAPMAAADGVRAPGLGGRAEQWLLRNPMSAVLRREIGAVRASGRTVVAITPGSEDMRGLGWNFMNRRHRRAAFDSARIHAPAAVRRALEAATPAAPHSPGRRREWPEAQ
ncbi:patatin-like phospholipase family protein [Nocardia fusca]|uniref:Patatin-like phospholipase family protein n=1 Tax=Nocardia fusca TaxID=941183 RepID=A0ABV3F318_9NOCA